MSADRCPTCGNPPLGPTGAFPHGHYTADDAGELTLAVATDTANRVIVVHFGTSVAWLALTAKDALVLGTALVARAEELAALPVS